MSAKEMRLRTGEAAGGVRTFAKSLAENPVAAVLTAIAAGFLVGLVLRLFEKPAREK